MKSTILSILGSFLVLSILIWIVNSNNVQAPAGYATYVIERPILGATSFHNIILGPNSTGREWRLYGDRVSVTPYSYSEEFKGTEAIIAKDKLPMIVSGHIVWRIRVTMSNDENNVGSGIRTYMEKFGGLDEQHTSDENAKLAYENYIQQPFKTFIREELATEDGLEIPNHLALMSDNITNKLRERLATTPFEILQVVIGNAQPPTEVLEQISLKVAKTQELQRKTIEQAISEAQKLIEQNNGMAAGEKEVAFANQKKLANQALSDSITPQLLQYLFLENMKSADRIYVPMTPNGMPFLPTLPINGVATKTQ